MKNFWMAAVLAIGFLITYCDAKDSRMGLIVVSADGRGFVERDSGKPYVPFGTNYYDPNTGWAPKIWKKFDAERVRSQFRVMHKLGVNCARVFLAVNFFQPTADVVEEEALKKLDTLIQIARENEIRLMLTGPDHWEGKASYWMPDRYGGEAALKALEKFWEVVGQRYKGEPAIFAWDLFNEPALPWFIEPWRPQWNNWLKEKYKNWDSLKAAWGDKLGESDKWEQVDIPAAEPSAGNPRLRDWQLFREHIADRWVRRQAEVIHRVDPERLITIGYIQWSYPLVSYGKPMACCYPAFNPRKQARFLDFISFHFYPELGEPCDSKEGRQKNIDYLRAALAYCHTGKPVMLSEFGWYGGGAAQKHPFLTEQQQADWIAAEIEATRSLAGGWLTWGFSDVPSSGDISIYSGMVKPDMTIKAWGHKFSSLAANRNGLVRPAPKLPEYDFSPAMTADDESIRKMHEDYTAAVQKSLDIASH